jgi:hypothetical protein
MGGPRAGWGARAPRKCEGTLAKSPKRLEQTSGFPSYQLGVRR